MPNDTPGMELQNNGLNLHFHYKSCEVFSLGDDIKKKYLIELLINNQKKVGRFNNLKYLMIRHHHQQEDKEIYY